MKPRLIRYTVEGFFVGQEFATPEKEQKFNKMVAELTPLNEMIVSLLGLVDQRLTASGAIGMLEHGDLFLTVLKQELIGVAYRSGEHVWIIGCQVKSTLEAIAKLAKEKSGVVRLELRTPQKSVVKDARKAGFRKVGVMRLGGLTQGRRVDTFLLERILDEKHTGWIRNWLTKIQERINGSIPSFLGRKPSTRSSSPTSDRASTSTTSAGRCVSSAVGVREPAASAAASTSTTSPISGAASSQRGSSSSVPELLSEPSGAGTAGAVSSESKLGSFGGYLG